MSTNGHSAGVHPAGELASDSSSTLANKSSFYSQAMGIATNYKLEHLVLENMKVCFLPTSNSQFLI